MTKCRTKLIVKYYESLFDFILTEETEGNLKGFLKWDEEDKIRYLATEHLHKEDIDGWYLDKNGDRLNDENLFAQSPWSMIEHGKVIQVVQRFFSAKNGEIIFSKQPWFQWFVKN